MTTTTATLSSSSTAMKATSSSIHLPSESSTAATLRSLYPRAAKAFLLRDITLTHLLLESAFSLLGPPTTAIHDTLAAHRRKWDVLRITLETTLYAAPPDAEAARALPAELRAHAMLSPPSFLAGLHARSLLLFTPAKLRPSAAFLPSQILVTLVLSALKLECPDLARGVIDDWLATRGQAQAGEEVANPEALEGYEKVLEMYCLHVLPRLGEWEYANEFLSYERELPQARREVR